MKLSLSNLMVPAAFILMASVKTTEAKIRGVRGTQSEIMDSHENGFENRIDLLERRLAKKTSKTKTTSKRAKDQKRMKGTPAASSTIESRLDPPSPTAAPVPTKPTLDDWIEGCPRESSNIDRCVTDGINLCKNCLHVLSYTSVTPSTANGSVNACKRNFCGSCDTEDLMMFFDCGFGISNPIADAEIPFMGSSIRTPPPSNAIGAAFSDAAAVDKNIDLGNCPAVFPKSGTECVMVEGFEFKKCFYYEVGTDVVCDCGKEDLIWDCKGTITKEEFIVQTEDLKVDIEEKDELAALPSIDMVFSRIDTNDSKFCPITTPVMGTPCSTADFSSYECCYEAEKPYPNTLGTITCTCSEDERVFQCMGGSLSTCTLG
eukprot:CAMPEP_0197173396 /NCGR_PEP_ID=MMETSP1423-20130617/348_1 /TAXON_ID=476441 /ORGANISM="Pseudo-nitzschia heimii, Strain UNC1101" /LENGTH=373 /DNA_ID=CAMNT_0042622211 /DNA_START=74 /DNA_END=1195 /DNA_ORIENTATION=+